MIEILLLENSGENADFIISTLKIIYADINIEWVPSAQEALDFIFAIGMYQYRVARPLPKVLLLSTIRAEDSPLDIISVLKSYARTQHLPIIVISDTPDKAATVAGATSCIVWGTETRKFIAALELVVMYWLKTPQGDKTSMKSDREDDTVAASGRSRNVHH